MKSAGKREAKSGVPRAASGERRAGSTSALLVIGYGNELRSDDGVGPKTAAAVAEWNLPDVRTVICHQLTPELAVPIAAAQCVIFVDAAVDCGTSVELHALQPADSAEVMAHAPDPHSLLGLAKDIFGRSPSAFWLTIPIENVDFGENLSACAHDGMQIALEKIRQLLTPGNGSGA
jgi:hydrogenase maturation protease